MKLHFGGDPDPRFPDQENDLELEICKKNSLLTTAFVTESPE